MNVSLHCWVLLVLAAILLVCADQQSDMTPSYNDAGNSWLRERRQDYIMGSGYATMGCSCPQSSCDDNLNNLLAFGAGTILGLFFSVLRNILGSVITGRSSSVNSTMAYGDSFDSARRAANPSLLQLLNLPDTFGDDLAPIMADYLQVYSRIGTQPECLQRWVCEITRKSLNEGGLRARITTTLSSVALGWHAKDISREVQNLISNASEGDCKVLSPNCDTAHRDIR